MVANYAVHFQEPWQGVPLDGKFNRWVYSKEEAEENRIKYENFYRKTYDDEYARVELISVN